MLLASFITSILVVSCVSGRSSRLRKPCNKKNNKQNGPTGIEVDIVHEVEKTTTLPNRHVTLGNPDDFREKIGALRHYVDFQDFWDDYMYRRYFHVYDALADPWYTTSQPLQEDDYFLFEPVFIYKN